eukprot:Rhum_TRINITY_DN11759_c0_g2::Rhum_TRINITY_DN11759_c0_g2_i1::g.46687::m.46687
MPEACSASSMSPVQAFSTLVLLLAAYVDGQGTLVPAACPGVFDLDSTASTGTIKYPTTGSYSASENRCWRIQADGTSFVHIRWDSMMIEDHFQCVSGNGGCFGTCSYNEGVGCTKDALTVYDSSGGEMKLCTTDGSLPDYQVQVAGDVVLRFSSDTTNHNTGFSIAWELCSFAGDAFAVSPDVCHHAYESNQVTPGQIKFPTTNPYTGGRRSCWRLLCFGQVEITWTVINLEAKASSGGECVYDFIDVYDSAGHVMRECGVHTNKGTTRFRQGSVVVNFFSDLCTNGDGFTLDWTCTAATAPAAPPAAGTAFTAAAVSCASFTTTETTPGAFRFGTTTYTANVDRCHLLACSGQVSVAFTLLDLNVPSSKICINDWIMFRGLNGYESPPYCATPFMRISLPVGDIAVRIRTGTTPVGSGIGFTWTCGAIATPTPVASPTHPALPPFGFCEPDKTCDLHTCVKGQLKASPNTISCGGKTLAFCTDLICCDLHCDSHTCSAPLLQDKPTPAGIACPAHVCTDALCCDTVVKCGGHACNMPTFQDVANKANVVCLGSPPTCTDAVCCDNVVLCSTFTCNTGFQDKAGKAAILCASMPPVCDDA